MATTAQYTSVFTCVKDNFSVKYNGNTWVPRWFTSISKAFVILNFGRKCLEVGSTPRNSIKACSKFFSRCLRFPESSVLLVFVFGRCGAKTGICSVNYHNEVISSSHTNSAISSTAR